MSPRPNIVLIMCDQMRWDAAGFRGQSHGADAAPQSVGREMAFALGTRTVLLRCVRLRGASWLTGLYPHAHLQLRNYGPGRKGEFGSYLPDNCITIGDVLKAGRISLRHRRTVASWR